MPTILETKDFLVLGSDRPHHDRNNGGHAKVLPKLAYSDRTEMPIGLYIVMMELVLITGEAIIKVMRQKGIDVVRINYQDNGNWSYFPQIQKQPHIHIHLYVRSNGEKHPTGDPRFHAFPEALYLPFIGHHPDYYESFQPYSQEDCLDFKNEILRLLTTDKYKDLKILP